MYEEGRERLEEATFPKMKLEENVLDGGEYDWTREYSQYMTFKSHDRTGTRVGVGVAVSEIFQPVDGIYLTTSTPHSPTRNEMLTLDLLCIGSARIMRVYLFARCTLIEAHKAVQEVIACRIVVVAATRPYDTDELGNPRQSPMSAHPV